MCVSHFYGHANINWQFFVELLFFHHFATIKVICFVLIF